MKALIFNSGLGSRLGEYTSDRPKCLVELSNGESILERQLRVLAACGICDFVITLGPFAEKVIAACRRFESAGCSFEFVVNERYAETNYLYSMHLAEPHLRGEGFIMLHGDLVFDAAFAQAVLDAPAESLGAVNAAIDLPEKDFKARVQDGAIVEVSVNIFDDGCVAFQPFYKLSREAGSLWLDAVSGYVSRGKLGVYAENAANEVFGEMGVSAFSYEGHFVAEIDTPEDLRDVSDRIRSFDFAQQPLFIWEGGRLRPEKSSRHVGAMRSASDICEVLDALGVGKPLIVSGSRFEGCSFARSLETRELEAARFGGFSPNPRADEVERGYQAFCSGGHDSLISYGGGSAIDVAKCIKARLSIDFAQGEAGIGYKPVPHIAIATTAGTGSESTRFAVCYVDGKKVSVTHDSLFPEVAILDVDSLEGLSDYQRKSTFLDALCQAIESYWSRAASDASRDYAARAMRQLAGIGRAYCQGDAACRHDAAVAANLAGKAINLTTTTAPHAMSYQLTSRFGLAHGHAVALCMEPCWRYLIEHANRDLETRLREIACSITGGTCASSANGVEWFDALFASLNLPAPVIDEPVSRMLAASVNVERLGNFPLAPTQREVEALYLAIPGSYVRRGIEAVDS